MAAKKASVKSTEKVVKKKTTLKKDEGFPSLDILTPEKSTNPFTVKRIIIGLLIGAVLVLAIYKKGIFITATVNGSPITTVELVGRLLQNFKKQELDNMIVEKIVLGEARKKNVLPTNQEVQDKVAQVEQKVGGKDAFDNLLSQQGRSRASYEQELRLQIAIEKLYSNEASASEQEINDFIKQYKTQLEANGATDSAKQKEQAIEVIKQRKLSEIAFQKIDELRKSASVKIF